MQSDLKFFTVRTNELLAAIPVLLADRIPGRFYAVN